MTDEAGFKVQSFCVLLNFNQFTPIERVTKDVSAESSAATDVIPLVIGIKRALDKQWLVDAVDAVHCRIQLQRVQLQRATTTTAP